MGQTVSTPRAAIHPTWWAPVAVVCAVAIPVGALLPPMLGSVGDIAFPVSLLGLVAAIVAVVRERRLGWRLAALLAGLFHLAVLALDAFLTLWMHGAFSS